MGFLVGAEGLAVTAPKWVPPGEIDAGVQSKAAWILRKLHETSERQQRVESARIAWLAQVGALPDPARASEGPVIVHAHCSFLKQLTYPGEIEVTTYVGAPGPASLKGSHGIRPVLENCSECGHGICLR